MSQLLFRETPTTLSTKKLLILLFVLSIRSALAQSTYLIGTLPSVNISTNLNENYGLNFKSEFRQVFAAGFMGDEPIFDHRYIHTDLSVMAARKVGTENKVAFGYLIRMREDGENLHRLTQQIALMSNMNGFRLAHRIRTDETFHANGEPRFRLRYRAASDFALNGATIDPREFYIKLTNEYVNDWQGGNYSLEVRVTPLLGYAINDTNKLEIGLDYRIGSVLKDINTNSFWAMINWYLKL